jgi:hypothetical protein
LVVMFALGCSDSQGSNGCGSGTSTQRCEINTTATVCGDLITMECFDGDTPDATAQCTLALEQADESVYCCTNAAEPPAPAADTSGGSGGTGGAGT